MTTQPAVIVKKGGFLSALATGLFGFLTVTVICGTALGYRGMNLVSAHADDVQKLISGVVEQLPKWRETLPPAIVEALNDRRAPDYVKDLDIESKLVERDNSYVHVITVKNRGTEIVSFLALNVQAEDEDGIPVSVNTAWAATPFALDEPQWRGPLMPGTSCKFSLPMKASRRHSIEKVNLTVRDLRVAIKSAATEQRLSTVSDGVELSRNGN